MTVQRAVLYQWSLLDDHRLCWCDRLKRTRNGLGGLHEIVGREMRDWILSDAEIDSNKRSK